MDKLKILIVFFLLINTQFISAQQTIALDETVYLHTNTSTFVTGETLFYKIYCLKALDKRPSVISKIGYVELIDSNRKSIFKAKIKLENSQGQGEYFIPTTLKTGSYKIIGYTNWMLNKTTTEIFQTNITIINPYTANPIENASNTITKNTLINQTNEHIQNPLVYTNENVKFKLDKKVFSNRELVNLKLEASDKNFIDGNYSLSVRKIDELTFGKTIRAADFSTKENVQIIDLVNKEKKIILPELRGEIITGKVIAKNSTDKVENVAVALSLPGKSFSLQIYKTDSDGNFVFNFNSTNYNSNVVIQVIDEHADNYTVSLDVSPEVDYSKLSFETYNPSYIYKESVLNRSISSQIENAYFYKKTDSIVPPTFEEPFISGFSKEYILDNYTRFNTINETITEVATEIYSKKINNNFYLHVTDNSIPNQLPESALVLFDGLLIQNQNDLINYNMKNVYKINVIVGRYYVGPKSFNGLISFTSFEHNFESKQNGNSILKTNFLRPQLKKIYYKINYSNPVDNERIPDFRSQLFWNADVQLNSESNNSFYTSDLSGKFEIKLEGFSKNGLPISIEDTIEVKDFNLE